MKILKYLLIAVAGIIALFLIVALLTKKDFTVEREITINKPNQDVFNYIKQIKNQDHYSKWAMMDPNAKKTYTGTDGTVGFTSAWTSDVKNVGQGEQQISKVEEGKRIDMNLHFIKPMDSKADSYMSTEAISPTQTKVKWGFHSKMPYPMNLMLLFMDFDKMLGGDLQTGLDNLKGVLEK